VTVSGRRPQFQVVPGPLDLPLARHHVAVVGIGRRHVTLSLRSTDDVRGTPFEVGLHGPFTLAGTRVETAPEIARALEQLIEVGIVSARTGVLDALELELMTGDRLASDSGWWSVEATDSRRWEAQAGGGIGIWSTDQVAGADDDAPDELQTSLSAAAPDAGDDPFHDPLEATVEIGRGLDLPGPGLVLANLEVGIGGRLSLSLESEALTSAPANAGPAGTDVTEAFKFFSTLNVGPGTVPPDPEVLAAMKAAVETSDFGRRDGIWIAVDETEPPAPEIAPRLLGALGTAAMSVHVRPGGRLEVAFPDGVELSSPDWWVRQVDGDRWEGSAGRVMRRRFHDDTPDLSPADAATLAAAWLHHDRTGRETRFWAWERVNDVIRRQPLTGWLLVRSLIAGAADESQLMSVAAGPLEDFLGEHSGALIDQVEDAARADPRVMLALRGVWKNAIDDEDWLRIQALLGR
jgi:hypothetical protein